MAGLRDLDSGKIYIGPEEPKKLDKSVKTKNGDKPFDGTLAVTGPVFLGAHSEDAFGVVNIGTALGDFKPKNSKVALDVQGDVNIVGDGSGKQGVNALVIDGDLFVTGAIDGGNKGRLASRFATADSLPKPFDMVHPSKGEGHRLRYACIEGPEVGVYCRGRVKNDTEIVLPNYWKDLVHVDSISVQLQPIGAHQDIIVKRWDEEKIYLQAKPGFPINCFYHVYAERKDINPLIVEYQGDSWEDYPDPNFNPEKVDEDKRTYTDPRFAGPQNTFTG